MTNLTLSLFGSLSVSINDQPIERFRSNRVPALMAYLLVETNRGQIIFRRADLAELFWPGMPAKSALQNLRQTIYVLRKLWPDNEIPLLNITNRQTIQVNADCSIWVDVNRFNKLLAHHPDHWHEAIELYMGDFLAGFELLDAAPFDLWVADQRAELKRKVLDAITSLVDIQIERKAYSEAEKLLQKQLSIDPLREKAHQQMMLTLAFDGRRAAALQQFESCAHLLQEELGAPISQETRLIAEAIQADRLPTLGRTEAQLGGYDLKEMIGSGNFGAVYRAIQPTVGREVAVKIIRDKYANDSNFIRQFEAEAQTIARLEHPHIVPLYDFWREPGSAYLVMRWLRGGSLADQLNDGWPLEKAMPLVQQIGQALHAAHERGVIHRDIKPANILIDEEGNGYLSDFGIASSSPNGGYSTLRGETNDERSTSADMLLSATSASPEQLQGRTPSIASDIYSFGVLLYQLLTGHHPFNAESPVHMAILHTTQRLPNITSHCPNLPDAVNEVIQKATAKQPGERYVSILDLVAAFQNAISQNEAGRYALPKIIRTDIDNPYKGLQPFNENDADLFFGRETLRDQLKEKMIESQFVALVGASGSGKSSVVKAGLLPALRDENHTESADWFIIDMLPSTDPFSELEKALAQVAVENPKTLIEQLKNKDIDLVEVLSHLLPNGSSSKLLLVIDQFEELFTLVGDTQLQSDFIDMLLDGIKAPNGQFKCIVTLRADFYDRPLMVDGLGELMKSHTQVITPLTAEELNQVIQKPAAQVGVTVEPALVTTMVADIKEQPGGLPLLQYALTELYEHRNGNELTLQRYHEIGGVEGALAQRAEEIYSEIEPGSQPWVRQLFLRLITLGEGVEDTRRRVLRSELLSLTGVGQALDSILDRYGSSRLLAYDRDLATRESTVEVAHEALLREWPRLRRWLEESRHDLRQQRLLNESAVAWDAAENDTSFLLRGSRLEQFKDWQQTSKQVELNENENRFLVASLQAQEAEVAAEAERQQRELETAQQLAETERKRAVEQEASAGRLRQRAFGLAGALVLAMLLAIAAFVFGQRATSNANLAATNEAEAQDNANLAATSEVEALAQAEIAKTNADLAATREAEALAAQVEIGFERDRAEEQARLAEARELAAQAKVVQELDPELSIILARESLQLADTQEAETSLHLGLQRSRIRNVIPSEGDWGELSPNRQFMVAGPWEDGPISIRDTISQEVLMTIDATYGSFIDDRHILTEKQTGAQFVNFEVWDVEKKQQIDHPLANTIGPIANVGDPEIRFLSNMQDNLLVTNTKENEIIIWDMINNEQLTIISEHQAQVTFMQFHPESKQLVSGDISKQVYIWDLSEIRSNRTVSKITEFKAFQNSGSEGGENGMGGNFTPNGDKLLLVGVIEFEPEVWDLNEIDQPPITLANGGNSLQSGVFNREGSLLIGHLAGGTEIVTWDLTTGDILFTIKGIDFSGVVGLTNDESQLITIGSGAARFWDIRSSNGSETKPYPVIPFTTALQASPNGKFLALGSLVGPAYLISRETGEIIHTLAGEGGVNDLFFSPDGSEIVTVGADDIVRKWDVESGELLLDFKGHDSEVYNNFMLGTMDVRYHPSGDFFATASSDRLIKFWNAESGELIRTISGYPTPINDIAFSPDGKTLAASGSQDADNHTEIWIWDVESGDYLATLGKNEGISWGLEFHPTEPLLATNGWNGLVRVWNYQTGEVAYETLNETGGTMLKLSFSDDGRYLATAGNAAPAQIYDSLSGELLATLTDYPAGGAEFTPDNHLIIGTFFDGLIRELTVELDDALALADERVTRALSPAECLKYLRRSNCETTGG